MGRFADGIIHHKKLIIILFLVIVAISVLLLLTTASWIEPVLFLAAIGVSVVINMGTNVFLGEVSFVTKAVTPILQLACSLDYAIFLLHSFSEQRKICADVEQAMCTPSRSPSQPLQPAQQQHFLVFWRLCLCASASAEISG